MHKVISKPKINDKNPKVKILSLYQLEYPYYTKVEHDDLDVKIRFYVTGSAFVDVCPRDQCTLRSHHPETPPHHNVKFFLVLDFKRYAAESIHPASPEK